MGRYTSRSTMKTPASTHLLPVSPPVATAPTHVYRAGDNFYVNLTSRCSSDCTFCLRNSSWEVFGVNLHLTEEDEPSVAQVIDAILAQSGEPREVVFTGLGEPTVRLEELLGLVRWLSSRHLVSRLDTNGHGRLVHPDRDIVAELVSAGLSKVSVSLNAADAETYETLCRPHGKDVFPAVTSFIRDCVQAGLDTTATMVSVPGVSEREVSALAGRLGARFRARAYVSAGIR